MRPLLASAVLVVAGCSTPEPGVVCTMEFRTVSVRVVDDTGSPLPGLTSEPVVVDTGVRLAVSHAEPGPDGTYPVATDSDRESLSPDGSAVRFTATSADWQATAAFEIAGGPCHIEALSGPSEIVAERR